MSTEPNAEAKVLEGVIERNLRLLQTGEFSDFSIETQNKTFKVHKFMLQAAGGYFAAACGQNFAEGTSGSLTLDDCDSDAMKAVLQFIYSDSYETRKASNGGAEISDLLLHAQVEQLAMRFMLPLLHIYACHRFSQATEILASNKDFPVGLRCAIDFVYQDGGCLSGEAFRMLICKTAHKLCERQDMKSAARDEFLEGNPIVGADVLSAMKQEPAKGTRFHYLCKTCIHVMRTSDESADGKPDCRFCGGETRSLHLFTVPASGNRITWRA